MKIYNHAGQYTRDLHPSVTMRTEPDPHREGMLKVFVGSRQVGWSKEGEQSQPHPAARTDGQRGIQGRYDAGRLVHDYSKQETP